MAALDRLRSRESRLQELAVALLTEQVDPYEATLQLLTATYYTVSSAANRYGGINKKSFKVSQTIQTVTVTLCWGVARKYIRKLVVIMLHIYKVATQRG